MRRIAVLLVGVVLLAAPSLAMAQGSSECQAYHPETTCNVPQQTLPFTGLDVALLVVGGGALTGVGLVVRRLSRRPS